MPMAKKRPEIQVTAVYDGELDAMDVFVGLITQRYGNRRRNYQSNGIIEQEYLAKKKETGYNDGEVQKSQMPSGLCG